MLDVMTNGHRQDPKLPPPIPQEEKRELEAAQREDAILRRMTDKLLDDYRRQDGALQDRHPAPLTMFKRTAVYATVLAALYLLAVINEEIFTAIVGLAAIVIPAFHFATWRLLNWASNQAPEIQSLRGRTIDAYTLWIISSAAGIAGGITLLRIAGFNIEGRPVLVLIGFMIVMMAVPALDWLKTFRDLWLPSIRRRQ